MLNTALNRGQCLGEIDFVFGGSTLNILQQRKIPKSWSCIVQRFKNTLSVRRFPNYRWKEYEIGKQLENLLIDGNLHVKDDNERYENLTMLKVEDADRRCTFSILCFAEIDGLLKLDSSSPPIPCEIKCLNPKYWGCKVPLQMISNNSQKLIYGEKERHIEDKERIKFRLTDIKEFDRDEIIARQSVSKIREREGNILYCLNELNRIKSTLEEHKVHLLNFIDGNISVELAGREFDDCQIRPDVVNGLLSN